MKAVPTIAIGVVAIALLAVACDNGDGGATPAPTPTTTPEATPTPEPSVCQPNPDPASTDVLVIDTPDPSAEVTSPVTVSGQIAAFEAAFRITIFSSGNVVADDPGMAQEGQVLSPFSEQVEFSITEPTAACIWVYQESALDGSPTQVGQVPVTLLP